MSIGNLEISEMTRTMFTSYLSAKMTVKPF